MKKTSFLLFLTLLLAAGCSPAARESKTLARINNYEISLEEFEEEFRDSPYARNNTPEAKRDFLNMLINRKLILQDAQKRGLDKDERFLRMVERFWEQSLLKLALDKKSKEIAGKAVVNDKTIEAAYQNMLKEGKTDKTYDQMYNQVKWEITKLKETQLLNEWMEGLHKSAQIKVDFDLLKEQKQ